MGPRSTRQIVGCTSSDEGSSAAAATRLVEAHADEVHRYLSRLTGGDQHLTADLLQNVFVTALSDHDRQLHEIELPWLITVARSRFIDHVRATSSRQRRESMVVRLTHSRVSAMDANVVSADQARWMLAQLPDLERWALGLAVIDGMPVAELSVVLGRSIDATHSVLARARRRLRQVMEEVPDDAH